MKDSIMFRALIPRCKSEIKYKNQLSEKNSVISVISHLFLAIKHSQELAYHIKDQEWDSFQVKGCDTSVIKEFDPLEDKELDPLGIKEEFDTERDPLEVNEFDPLEGEGREPLRIKEECDNLVDEEEINDQQFTILGEAFDNVFEMNLMFHIFFMLAGDKCMSF